MLRLRSALAFAGLALVSSGACRHEQAPAPRSVEQEAPDASASADVGLPVDAGPRVVPSAKAGWWRNAVFYEIFVRSFSDANGDGVGDFAGLTSKLDYLNDGDPSTNDDLGVDALWLMPIMASPSYHGYDVTNYKAVNPDYGTLEDFDRLIAEAHRRGIKVILDFVLNHASSQHPWFRRSRANEQPYRDYFVWKPQPDTRWRRPWDGANVWHQDRSGYYFGIFWSGMPDWNLQHSDVEAHMLDALRFWLERGVDGFRIDAVRYLLETDEGRLADIPETHAFVQNLRRQLADFPEAVWVAEAWTNQAIVADYFGTDGDEFQLAFSFDVASAIKSSVNDGNRANLNQALGEARRVMVDRGFEAPFLANHDMPRVMRVLGNDEAAMRVAAATLMALPGTPFLYYGEEIGLSGGGSSRDEDKRTPMHWTSEGPGYGFTTGDRLWHPSEEPASVSVAAQRGQPNSLWTLYRDLIALRKSEPALSDGASGQPVVQDGGRGVVAIVRGAGADRVLFVANYGPERSAFSVQVGGQPTVLMGQGMGEVARADAQRLTIAELAPRGFAFIKLRP